MERSERTVQLQDSEVDPDLSLCALANKVPHSATPELLNSSWEISRRTMRRTWCRGERHAEAGIIVYGRVF